MHQSPTPAEITYAATLLRAGRLVAFPTETVYGLGANALDPEAVARIYAVKRRPSTSPLIVHVASVEMAESLVSDWPRAAGLLTREFWPGPLTLVLSKKTRHENDRTGVPLVQTSQYTAAPTASLVPDIVTAGLSTVAVRMPSHPVALSLICAAGVPLAAPSANRFTELSSTTASHVRLSLGNEVDLILDGGPCQVGIESTVLSLADPHCPVLLRPGGISRQRIESLIGPIASANEAPTGAHPSPGMHPRHYSPRTSLLLVSNGTLPAQGKGIYLQYMHPPTRPTHLATSNIPSGAEPRDIMIMQMPIAPADYAAALYSRLHQADEAGLDWIAVDHPPTTPDWEAVLDRLRRAATKGR